MGACTHILTFLPVPSMTLKAKVAGEFESKVPILQCPSRGRACVEINISASTPSTRRLLDGVEAHEGHRVALGRLHRDLERRRVLEDRLDGSIADRLPK